MAAKNRNNASKAWTEGERVEIPQNATHATSKLADTRKLIEGGQIAGIFVKAKMATIQDTETHEDKEVMVYTFRDRTTGEPFAVLGGRVGLDNAFDDLFMRQGGQEKVSGMMVVIERGEDSERSNGRKGIIGNYDVFAWSLKD